MIIGMLFFSIKYAKVTPPVAPTGEDYWSTNDPEEIKRFMESQQWSKGQNLGEGFNFSSWTHVTDDEFVGNLTFNDETNTFYSSYGTVENGVATTVGVSIKANLVSDGLASVKTASGQMHDDWCKSAYGGLDNVYPEFATIGGGTKAGWGLLKWVWGQMTSPVSTINTIDANAAKDLALKKGFKESKEFGYQNGQKVYKYQGKYYSRDVDSHNGGVWKVFEKVGGKLTRIGTTDENLNIIKK